MSVECEKDETERTQPPGKPGTAALRAYYRNERTRVADVTSACLGAVKRSRAGLTMDREITLTKAGQDAGGCPEAETHLASCAHQRGHAVADTSEDAGPGSLTGPPAW